MIDMRYISDSHNTTSTLILYQHYISLACTGIVWSLFLVLCATNVMVPILILTVIDCIEICTISIAPNINTCVLYILLLLIFHLRPNIPPAS